MPLMTIGRQASNNVSSSFSYRVRVLKSSPVETRQSVSLSQSGMVERLSREMTAPLVAAIARSRSSRGAARVALLFGSIRRRWIFAEVDLAEPCSPLSARIGYGPFGRNAATRHPMNRRHWLSWSSSRTFTNRRS